MEISTIERRFRKIKFDALKDKESEVTELVKIQSNALTSIEICNSTFNAQQFMNILASISKLKTVSIVNSFFLSIDDVNILPLRKLRHLKVLSSDLKVLKIFSASQIKSLEISKCDRVECLFKDFLSTQSQLEELKIVLKEFRFLDFILNDFPIQQCPFKLKRLTIRCSDVLSSIWLIDRDFIDFLSLHVTTLQELELAIEVSPEVVSFIITYLRSLKKLSVNMLQLPHDNEFYKNLEPSSNIKELILEGKFLGQNTAERFLRCFKEIESLTLQIGSEEVFKSIESICKKIRCMTITKFSIFFPLTLNFPCLKEVHVGEMRSLSTLNIFITENPTIERFTIKEIFLKDISKTTVEIITHAANIKSLQVRGVSKAMKKFLDIVKEVGWNKLESMELIVKNMNESFTRSFCFNLPKDTKLWQPECPYLDYFIWNNEQKCEHDNEEIDNTSLEEFF